MDKSAMDSLASIRYLEGELVNEKPTTSLRNFHDRMTLTRAIVDSRKKNHMLAAGDNNEEEEVP